MTVAELIAELSKLDQSNIVLTQPSPGIYRIVDGLNWDVPVAGDGDLFHEAQDDDDDDNCYHAVVLG